MKSTGWPIEVSNFGGFKRIWNSKLPGSIKEKAVSGDFRQMKKFTSQEIREFVSKPMFDEKVILKKDSSYLKISIVTPFCNQAEFLKN